MTDPNLPEWCVVTNGRDDAYVTAVNAHEAAVFAADDSSLIPTGTLGNFSVFTSFDTGVEYYVEPVAAVPAKEEEDLAAVVIAVHDDVIKDGQMQFVQKNYALPLSVQAQIHELASQYEIL